ncbi:hypothetical protein R9X47_17360 [Wukongibacter baidiensis]|uniref:hypothetical protein n=1 Tax=Wukongibacter baidiensis TaxID=1723361 RepID=UPI003D7F1A2A
MEKLTIYSQDKYVEVESEDIRNIIESFDGVGEVRNISNTVGEGVMCFDVSLTSDYVGELLRNEVEEMDYSSDEEQEAILFEQAEYISDALVDNIREFIESRYSLSDFHGAYDVYGANLEEGIGITFTLSFGEVKHGGLYKLASSINDGKNEFR